MTPAGFPHSDIHGSKPACGSPWLFAAYHVFLRRPVPWHPPCALSNLIVTNLSSCQRIDFAIFNFYFLLRPTAKLSHFCARALIYIIASQLVSLQDVFHLAVQFSRYFRLSIARSLKTIQFKEDRQSFDHSAFRFVDFSALRLLQSFDCQQTRLISLTRLYRPGMSNSLSCLALSLERR